MVTPANRKNKTSYPGADPRTDPGRQLPPLQPGYHDDVALLPIVDALLALVELFVETGTANGSTLLYTAERVEALQLKDFPLASCEPHLPIAEYARRNLWKYPNALIFNDESLPFLERLAPMFRDTPTLFFLDAHSHGFGDGCPLRREISFILSHWRGGYIIADDIAVPGQPQFGFDQYENIGAINWEMIRPAVEGGPVREIWWPCHKVKSKKKQPLRGWCLLTFGDAPLIPIPATVMPMVQGSAIVNRQGAEDEWTPRPAKDGG